MAPSADKDRRDSKRADATAQPQRNSHDDVDDATLRQCIAGDADAIHRVVKRYEGRIRAFLRARISPRPGNMDVQELAQDTFVRAFRHMDSFKLQSEGGSARFSTWLYGIAKSVAIDWTRKQKRQVRTVGLEANEGAAFLIAVAGDQESAEPRSLFMRAVRQLSDELQIVLFLCDVQDKSYKEVSEICGIPENTVKSRLFRAREEVRRHVKGEDR